jgi:hypothetical protein
VREIYTTRGAAARSQITPYENKAVLGSALIKGTMLLASTEIDRRVNRLEVAGNEKPTHDS